MRRVRGKRRSWWKKLVEVTKQQLRHLGMKEAPACRCGKKEWKYVKYEGAEPLKTVWVLARCSCHASMLWRSDMKNLWSRFEQAGGVV